MPNAFFIVEVCDANPAACAAVFALEEEFPGIVVMETSCMSECELCASRPYAFIDGLRMDAPTVEQLMANIRAHLALVMQQMRY